MVKNLDTLISNSQSMLSAKVRQLLCEIVCTQLSFSVDVSGLTAGSLMIDFTEHGELVNRMIYVQRTSTGHIAFFHTLGDKIDPHDDKTCAVYALLAVILYDDGFANTVNAIYSAYDLYKQQDNESK
jgi:hypothetical protein